MEASIGTPALWLGFTGFVLAMLALDLGVFHRKAHEVSAARGGHLERRLGLARRSSSAPACTTCFGAERGLEFPTGYLIEKALAVDNIFVFFAIFAYFAVPAAYQHRVLFWGVLGALVMRAIFIFAGAALIAKFHWVIYVFGAILVLTAIKLLADARRGHPPGAQSGLPAVPALRAVGDRVPRRALHRRPERQALRDAAAGRAGR